MNECMNERNEINVRDTSHANSKLPTDLAHIRFDSDLSICCFCSACVFPSDRFWWRWLQRRCVRKVTLFGFYAALRTRNTKWPTEKNWSFIIGPNKENENATILFDNSLLIIYIKRQPKQSHQSFQWKKKQRKECVRFFFFLWAGGETLISPHKLYHHLHLHSVFLFCFIYFVWRLPWSQRFILLVFMCVRFFLQPHGGVNEEDFRCLFYCNFLTRHFHSF